jgi:hypothetical protein
MGFPLIPKIFRDCGEKFDSYICLNVAARQRLEFCQGTTLPEKSSTAPSLIQ